jgi:type II secretory pathway component PulF
MYHYEATDRSGKTVVGSMSAKDEGSVQARLIQGGYKPTLIEAPGAGLPAQSPPMAAAATSANSGAVQSPPVQHPAERSLARKSVTVPDRELAQFYRQMAGMLKSGVPLPQALSQIVAYTKNAELKRAIEDMEGAVARGRPMSEAMDRHPRAFSAGHIGLIRSGEGAGFLDRAYGELAAQAEADWGVQAMARFNPLLFIIKAIGIPFLVMWLYFMSSMPAWQTTPALIGTYLGRAAIAAGGAFVIVIVFFPTLSHLIRLTPLGTAMRNLASVIPGLSARAKRVDRVKVLGSLASSLTSGIPLSVAWELAAEAADSDRFHRLMYEQLSGIKRGGTIPDAMYNTGLFTEQILQMARSGEMSGNLPEMLGQAIVFEREEAKHLGALLPWVFAVLAYLVFLLVAGSLVVKFAGSVYGGMVNSQ